MPIRKKLLILLFAIALLPLLLVSWHAHVVTRTLGHRLAERGRDLATERFSEHLRTMVESSGAILRKQKELVELALGLQALEVERHLAAPPSPTPQVIFDHEFDREEAPPSGLFPSPKHVRTRAGGKPEPMPITLEHQVIRLAPGVRREDAASDIARLAGLTGTYRTLYLDHPDLFFWQYTSLETGVHSSFPGHGGYPAGYDGRRRPWYREAKEAGRLVWSAPYVDAPTRQVIMTASAPVRRPGGAFAGVTAIDVQILSVLSESRIRSALPENIQTFFATVAPRGPGGEAGIRIIAYGGYREQKRDWNAAVRLDWLDSDDRTGVARLADEMEENASGQRRLPYRGRDSLWSYKSLGNLNFYLLYILPFDEVTAGAARVEALVEAETLRQLRIAGVASIVMVLLVGAVAYLSSRTVTAPVAELARAARRLAEGDFGARAAVRGGDELGELARAFNEMVPQLEDRIQVRQSLAMAREVQQSLLPKEAPEVEGFDIAGQSIYCDETGGDYYDFIDLSEAGPRRVGIAVGDVSGHGVASALLMATVRALLRSRAAQPGSLAELFGFINRHLAAEARGGRFLTMLYLVIDGGSGTVRWVNAGHDSAMVYDPGADRFTEFKAEDIPLGIKADWAFHEYEEKVGPGESGHILLIGTDGLWESRDPAGAMFGKEAVQEVVRRHKDASAREICAAIDRALADFRREEPPHDDVTLVVVKAVGGAA